MKRVISVFILFLFSCICYAVETVKFDLYLFGDKIGTTTITREVSLDGSEVYLLDSKSKAKFLWITRENHTQYTVVYKAGKLISSKVLEVDNSEGKKWTNVIWDGAKYLVDSYKGKFSFTEVPTFSVVCVFFKDITKVKRIFYEGEADFNIFKKTGEPETWEFKSSDGNRNVYHFLNGKIHAMELHASIATVKMIRVQ